MVKNLVVLTSIIIFLKGRFWGWIDWTQITVSVLPTCVTLESCFSAPWCFICRIPKYWTAWSFPSPGDLSNPGTGSRSSALQADSLQSEPPGKPMNKALVQFSYLVLPNSLRPHGLQHASPPCPSPTPRVYSNSCPLSQWCHPAISSSVIPFSSHLQSFPTTGSFPVSQFFASGGQSIGASASASVLPMTVQDWFLLGLTCWISLLSKGLSRVFSNTTVQKHQFFSTQPS